MAMQSTTDNIASSALLETSIGSLPSRRQKSNQISKIYKQASSLFLTRRLPEALSTLRPLVTTPRKEEESDDEEDSVSQSAPVALANAKYRIKIWSLYLTLLTSIVELGPQEGKAVLGSTEWRSIESKTRDGSIWDEVVGTGYAGDEAKIDAEVVVGLTTLLLALSPSQKVNQEHLESYFSTSDIFSFDMTCITNASELANPIADDRAAYDHGMSSPQDLNSRLKLLEIYTLHILPRNREWQYAKEFIQMSRIVDEETKEAFLHTLQALEEEDPAHEGHKHSDIVPKSDQSYVGREMQHLEPRQEDDGILATNLKAEKEPAPQHVRSNDGTHYGLDEPHRLPTPQNPPPDAPPHTRRVSSRPLHPESTGSSPTLSKRTPSTQNSSNSMSTRFQVLISNLSKTLSRNPVGLLRFLLFLAGLILTLARRDIRERVRRMAGTGWEKILQTVGMGMKVSYI